MVKALPLNSHQVLNTIETNGVVTKIAVKETQ